MSKLGIVSKKRNRTKNGLKKPRPLPKYKEESIEDEPQRTKVKRDHSIKMVKDDADPEAYNARLLR